MSDHGAISAQVLVVEDEQDHAEIMAEALHREGHVCTIVHDAESAKQELAHGRFDLIVTDLVMDAERDGLDVLAAARRSQPDAETILVTAHGDVPTAKAALKGGAYDFIEKPLDLEVFRTLCAHAIEAVQLRGDNAELRQQLSEKESFEGMIGTSAPIQRVIKTMRQVAPSRISVLITGESGTGKELVARAIHNHSNATGRFVPLNCAGLSESILEDELFGHVRGAFTGAERDREGRFEYANEGTLFLDEIGDMPMSMQAKLLRVLESGEVVRLGDNAPRMVRVRLISATNTDLGERVRDGSFREDLYFRIKGAQIELPPLRERREDIPLLARHFVQAFAEEQGMERVPELSDEAQRALMQHNWPGNIRQLKNVIQNMMVLADDDTLTPEHLPAEIREGSDQEAAAPALAAGSTAGMSLDQIEKQAIRDTLRLQQGNREETARILGIGERTLYRKLKEYGIK